MSNNYAGVRVLRIPESAARSVFERLEQLEAADAASRAHERYAYVIPDGITVTFDHPGGSTVKVVVAPRNLSASGMSMLHGGFVYPNTPCSVRLHRLDGGFETVNGSVTRCRVLAGRVHEIGVKFARPIEPEHFVPPEPNR
ncbi:MAG: hypothetical protein U1D55_16235 [Phycisphaerae bacterium]